MVVNVIILLKKNGVVIHSFLLEHHEDAKFYVEKYSKDFEVEVI